MSDVDRIQKLLSADSIETRIAAAIILGELRAKQPGVTHGLIELAKSPVPLVQRHALEALTKIGSAKKALDRAMELLTSPVAEVRQASHHALASIGEELIPTIRAKMPSANPEERRAFDAILAELGGKDAFTTLLSGLAQSDGEAAKAAALSVRQYVKEASTRQRKAYLTETEKFLGKLEKKKDPDKGMLLARAAAIKILGYLEDEGAIPMLVGYAEDEKEPSSIRQEAFIALRFVLGDRKMPTKLLDVFIEAAESEDRVLAQSALHTLAGLELPEQATRRLAKLIEHHDLDRVRFVIEHLGRQPGADATRVLVRVLTTMDRRRSEIAAGVLGGREDAIASLAKSLLETKEADRAWMIRNVLRPAAKKISAQMRRQLLDEAMDRLGGGKTKKKNGDRNWEALLDVVRDADPDAVAEALRILSARLRRGGGGDGGGGDREEKAQTVLALLCRSDRATDADRYALAALELHKGSNDTRPQARAGDPALQKLATLLSRGYDLGTALRKDKSMELEHLYYVGFHFVEQGHPIGEELLEVVIKKGGRAKLAKMAKNKLSLAET